MRRTNALLLALSALLLGGCESATDLAKDPPPAKLPPGYHAPVATPIDAGLQTAARRELSLALGSPDEVVRTHALEVIGDVVPGDAAPTVAPMVLPLLTDPSLLVRKAAAITAGRLKLAAAHDLLVTMAQAGPAAPAADPNEPTYALQAQIAAIFALHQLGDTRFSHVLEETAQDPRPQIRGDTALALELIGNTSAVPILVPMMKDPSEIVRLEAAEALWKLGDERGEDFLLPVTVSNMASDKMVALLALAGPRDRRVRKHEFGMLNDGYPAVALVAARACGQLGSDAGIGVAESGAKDGDPMLRALAALALGDIGRPDSQGTLRKLLSDEVPDVRVTAAGALLEIGRPPATGG